MSNIFSLKTGSLTELHDNIMFYLVIILFTVAWVLFLLIRNFIEVKLFISNKYLSHCTIFEVLWRIIPAIILMFIAFPSFSLLYLMDEVNDFLLSVLEEDGIILNYQSSGLFNLKEEFDESLLSESTFPSSGPTSDNPTVNPQDLYLTLPESSNFSQNPDQDKLCRALIHQQNHIKTIPNRPFIYHSYWEKLNQKDILIKRETLIRRVRAAGKIDEDYMISKPFEGRYAGEELIIQKKNHNLKL
jgi:hypothetical protein